MRISGTVRKMIIVMLITATIMIIAGAVASAFYHALIIIPFALGVLLTTFHNVAKVIWLERAVDKAVAVEDQTVAGNYIRVQYLLRLLFTALILVIAILLPFVDFLGAAVGIFTFHTAKWSLGFIVKNDDANFL